MKLLFAEVMELLQHQVSSLMTSMYWQFGCVFHELLQRSTWKCNENIANMATLQTWHERLGHQNQHHVMKVLNKHGVNVEANRFVVAVLWDKHVGGALELGQVNQA
jgi:hypothetical protein